MTLLYMTGSEIGLVALVAFVMFVLVTTVSDVAQSLVSQWRTK